MHPSSFRTPRLHPRTRARRLRLIAAAFFATAGALTWSAGPAAAANKGSTPSGLTWSTLSPPTHPAGLEGATETYDAADQTVVLFGGKLANGQLSDQTWVWDGSTWSSPQVGSNPPARDFASMAFDASLDQLILFGGSGAKGTLLDDTWTWNGASWNRVTTTSTPGPREGAALAADPDGNLVLFGGYGVDNGQVPPPTSTTTSTTVPKRHRKHRKVSKHARKSHSTTTTSTTSSSTTSTTDPRTTTSSSTSTTTTTSPVNGTSSGVSGSTSSSTSVSNAGPSRGSSRRALDTAALVHGPVETPQGAERPSVLDDTWILSRSSDGADQWTQATRTSDTPPARVGAAMAMGASSETVLFGGSSVAPGASARRAVRDDTWVWNGHAWIEIKMKHPPAARMDAVVDDDSGTEGLGNAVLFGGVGKTASFNDTWLWTGNSWKRLKPASPGMARSAAAGTFDAGDGQLVVFGGISSTGSVLDATQVLTTHAPTHLHLPPVGKGSKPSTTTNPSGHTGQTAGSGNPGTTGQGTSTGTTNQLGGKTTNVHRGDVITLSGSGFLPHAEITITFHSVETLVSRIRANGHGDFTATVNVPGTASGGDHHFEATGRGPKGLVHLATPVTVVGVRLAAAVARWIKLTLIGIAIAIPVVSWFVVGAVLRRRPAGAAG